MSSPTAPQSESMLPKIHRDELMSGVRTRGYQREMLEMSLRRNIIIALDTGSGKTHISILRLKIEAEKVPDKISWFLTPTVALCEQQHETIQTSTGLPVAIICGFDQPDKWTDIVLWESVLKTHRIVVSTPQVLLDALRHGYLDLGQQIGLIVFDEAHHAVDNDPYNAIMKEFYFVLPRRDSSMQASNDNKFRPHILGLTASPIYGGNVIQAFKTIETNLDCIVTTVTQTREELAMYVNKPRFMIERFEMAKHSTDSSMNVLALKSIIRKMKIEDDPYVKDLQSQLERLGLEEGVTSRAYLRLDQKLSKTMDKQETYVMKGLKDILRTAEDIERDLGPWAADWFVWKVAEVDRNDKRADLSSLGLPSLQNEESKYLRKQWKKVRALPPSEDIDDLVDGTSYKVDALIDALKAEKVYSERNGQAYSGLVFVTRRDCVVALGEILRRHTATSAEFSVACIVGSSDDYRHRKTSDLARQTLQMKQSDALSRFRTGDVTLLIATSVAEEGLDIQACGSVIRFDLPTNMASWAQSRGRARRQQSSFVLMFENDGTSDHLMDQWQRQEAEMQQMYTKAREDYFSNKVEEEDEEEALWLEKVLRSNTTSAMLTLDSAMPHLQYFCSKLSSARHASLSPIYDLDPPEYPEDFHRLLALEPHRAGLLEPYAGPFGASVTLPNQLPVHLRSFTTPAVHKTKRLALSHVAFEAYAALYKEGQLNENLLPWIDTAVENIDDLKSLLADVEKRKSMAHVIGQFDPFVPSESWRQHGMWWSIELCIEGMQPLIMLLPSEIESLPDMTLFDSEVSSRTLTFKTYGMVRLSEDQVEESAKYTQRIFWSLYGFDNRMSRDRLDFAMMLRPHVQTLQTDLRDPNGWHARRVWAENLEDSSYQLSTHAKPIAGTPAIPFSQRFGYQEDLVVVRDKTRVQQVYSFKGWRKSQLSEEEMERLLHRYRRLELEADSIEPPFIKAKEFSSRGDFRQLVRNPSATFIIGSPPEPDQKQKTVHHLLPTLAIFDLISSDEFQISRYIPYIMRHAQIALTVAAAQRDFLNSVQIDPVLLAAALTAPRSREPDHYQVLETLGDTVMKFLIVLQLYADHPYWSESFLTRRKDRIVCNSRLVRAAFEKSLARWIIRDAFTPKKWRPRYSTPPENGATYEEEPEELSTKMMADVVEAIIGAAYLTGGFDRAVQCMSLFNLGINWATVKQNLDAVASLSLSNQPSQVTPVYPPQLSIVEEILGHVFSDKRLLIEALSHPSHRSSYGTVSYERLEFLGDALLDMVVTEKIFETPRSKLTPGLIYLYKFAFVNQHLLSYLALRAKHIQISQVPVSETSGADAVHRLSPVEKTTYLWQTMAHSSTAILDEQKRTFDLWKLHGHEIEDAFKHGFKYPWAQLESLRASKIMSDVIESLISAVFLDTRGNFYAVEEVLERLGAMSVLRRILSSNSPLDTRHPVSHLQEVVAKRFKEKADKPTFVMEEQAGLTTCVVRIRETEIARHQVPTRGTVNKTLLKLLAADKALDVLMDNPDLLDEIADTLDSDNRVVDDDGGSGAQWTDTYNPDLESWGWNGIAENTES